MAILNKGYRGHADNYGDGLCEIIVTPVWALGSMELFPLPMQAYAIDISSPEKSLKDMQEAWDAARTAEHANKEGFKNLYIKMLAYKEFYNYDATLLATDSIRDLFDKVNDFDVFAKGHLKPETSHSLEVMMKNMNFNGPVAKVQPLLKLETATTEQPAIINRYELG